jgi:predicted  nucleic acid-binding Zn-ribbon protein
MTFGAVCSACGSHFVVNDGGGFSFEILRCDACGRERTILHSEIGELHAAFETAWRERSEDAGRKKRTKHVRTQKPRPGLSLEEEYQTKLTEFAGPCSCGGRFSSQAPIRCPDCGSRKFREDPAEPSILYD